MSEVRCVAPARGENRAGAMPERIGCVVPRQRGDLFAVEVGVHGQPVSRFAG
jgi:hypothetical protein